MVQLKHVLASCETASQCPTCSSFGRIFQNGTYLDLATNTTGFYATTNHCGRDGYGIRQAAMYSTVNGTVSKFGGYMAESHCIQETATFGDLDKPWKCISDSESPLEGLRVYADGRSGTTRFVNFFL